MMTTTFKRVAVAVAAVVMALGAYVAARDQNTNQPARPFMGRGGYGPQGRPGGPGGPMGFLPMFGRELQLTDSQRDQMKAIADSHRDEWRALGDRARTAHMALEDAVMADTFDETLIRQKSAEVAAVDVDVAVARARAFGEFAQILTADQKSKLTELRAHRKARASGRGLH